jgi:hypothetical protein
MAKKRKGIDFEKLIARGENPLGMTGQSPNGTTHAVGQGWNDFGRGRVPMEQVAEGGAWGGKRSNRTGE